MITYLISVLYCSASLTDITNVLVDILLVFVQYVCLLIRFSTYFVKISPGRHKISIERSFWVMVKQMLEMSNRFGVLCSIVAVFLLNCSIIVLVYLIK